jgi:hypothetical protein
MKGGAGGRRVWVEMDGLMVEGARAEAFEGSRFVVGGVCRLILEDKDRLSRGTLSLAWAVDTMLRSLSGLSS